MFNIVVQCEKGKWSDTTLLELFKNINIRSNIWSHQSHEFRENIAKHCERVEEQETRDRREELLWK